MRLTVPSLVCAECGIRWNALVSGAIRAAARTDLIVEDTKLDRLLEGVEDESHVRAYWRDFRWLGPTNAVREFLAAHSDFVVDRKVEPAYTQHPSGFLRRVR